MLRAYKSNVPHNMDDVEFWQRYCQHLFRRNSRRLKRIRGDTNQEEDDAMKEDNEKLAMFEEEGTNDAEDVSP